MTLNNVEGRDSKGRESGGLGLEVADCEQAITMLKPGKPEHYALLSHS